MMREVFDDPTHFGQHTENARLVVRQATAKDYEILEIEWLMHPEFPEDARGFPWAEFGKEPGSAAADTWIFLDGVSRIVLEDPSRSDETIEGFLATSVADCEDLSLSQLTGRALYVEYVAVARGISAGQRDGTASARCYWTTVLSRQRSVRMRSWVFWRRILVALQHASVTLDGKTLAVALTDASPITGYTVFWKNDEADELPAGAEWLNEKAHWACMAHTPSTDTPHLMVSAWERHWRSLVSSLYVHKEAASAARRTVRFWELTQLLLSRRI